MKIKNIIQLCKKNAHLYTYFDRERNIQWASDGYGLYPMPGLPILEGASICELYDLDKEKITIANHAELPALLDFSDCAKEAQLELFPTGLICGSKDLIPLLTEDRVYFVSQKDLSPLYDYALSNLTFFLRTPTKGMDFIAVKNGMELVAMIPPQDIITPQFADNLKRLTWLCNNTLRLLAERGIDDD